MLATTIVLAVSAGCASTTYRYGLKNRVDPKPALTEVNPLTFGERYLVAPRGETQWVRNIRVSHTGRLTLGRKTETVDVEEVADKDKPPILRAYLREWGWEVGQFFGGVDADASEADLLRIASKHPVFRIVP